MSGEIRLRRAECGARILRTLALTASRERTRSLTADGLRNGAFALVLAVGGWVLTGCASTPKRTLPQPEVAAAPRSTTPQPPGPTLPAPESKPVPKPVPPPAPKPKPLPQEDQPVPAGMIRVRIESQPAGALIVVGDKVVGHAPLVITLPVTLRGYFAEAVTIRARFLAQDAAQESVSVKELCEPVDRVPRTIVFTPGGATRVAF